MLILPYPCCSSLSRHATVCTQPNYQHKDATEPPSLHFGPRLGIERCGKINAMNSGSES
jgi:hypothetical protein